ncbi:MAG: class I SAM-dependent methyltransferase [Acidobacteria bacterium]|nr:class I SAM-dependent methyltransferase [Acidobacteriota bacterium]
MKILQIARRVSLSVFLSLIAVSALAQAQTAQKPFEPQVGQLGKDVVWVPTSQALVEQMLNVARVTAADYVIDLGSGDGRTVIAAAKRGARALGIEYNPDMVTLSRQNAIAAGVGERATFIKADLFDTDFSEATVITMFLLPQINMKLRPKILDMKPGTRVVSNTFTMEDWEPDQTVNIGGECEDWCTALFWIVPAKVEGIWRMPQGELALTQQFQQLTGRLGIQAITNAKMRGSDITFTSGGTVYTGTVKGSTIVGTTAAGDTWTANRQPS